MRFLWARRAALGVVFALFAVVVLAVPAFAHARLVEAFPEDGVDSSEVPGQIQLRFSEPVEAAFGPIEVSDEEGTRVDLDNARLDPENPEVVVVDLEEDLPTGRYRVSWRVTSEDGHPINDEYSFVVIPASRTESPDESTPVERVSEDDGASGPGTGTYIGGALVFVVATVGVAAIRRK